MPYEDKIMVASGDSEHPGTEEVSFETIPPRGGGAGGPGIYMGTCTTAAATAAKVVTLTDASGWELKQGVIVAVKFSNTNTFSATAQAPVTLNVNNTGAKNIYYGGSANPTGTNTTAFGRANYVNTYVYDGTYWVWAGSSQDNNTTYSAMSKSELTTGTATTSRVVRADYLKKGIEEIIEDKDTNFEGTRSEWNALSVAEKAKYLTMDFTDEGGFGDISDEDVTFTSSDVVDANANSWTVVSPIASGTTLNTLFSRVSQMFKNIRFLKNRVTNDFDYFLNQEKRVGTWINGEAIYKRTILINKSYNPTSNTTYSEDISSWYKNPIDNPIDGMIVIDTKVLAWWDGDLQGTTRGYGKNATINTQNWVAYTGGHIFDIYVEAGANILYVRVTANAKLYLKYVTVYYYRLNGT